MSNNKVVGVIGGMGPDATVELMQRVIELTPAEDDCDHIHMLVDNNPKVPSRLKALLGSANEKQDNPGPVIAEMATRLERAGADFLVMPCNTAHHYYHYAEEAVSIPVWHLIELCAGTIKSEHPDCTRIGVLASSATHAIGLFEPSFHAVGLSPIYPDHEVQNLVMRLIKAVKSGSVNERLLADYNAAVSSFAGKDTDCLFLGCSELSTVLPQHRQTLPVLDSVQILAKAIVAAAS